MIDYTTAIEKLFAHVRQIEELEEVEAVKSAGRVCGEDVVSKEDVPGFTRAAMDGFAVRSSDVGKAPVELDVVGDLPAGQKPERGIEEGQAVRIMTGAMMPPGADAVVMAEDCEDRGNRVLVKKIASPGDNVAPSGEDIKSGDIIIRKGTLIDWRHVGLLCACGISLLKVVRKPRVAVITTGDEIVEPWEKAEPPAVRNVNRYMLQSLVEAAGGEVIFSTHVGDNIEAVKDAFEKAVSADVILFNAGISTGVHDVVRAFVNEKAEEVFYKVAIKPGKPIYFGLVKEKPVFGLPGYPGSAAITFMRFVRPFLMKMQGISEETAIDGIWAVAGEDIYVKGKRETVIRVKLEKGAEDWIFYECPPHKAGTILSLSKSHGYITVNPRHGGVKKGMRYFVYLWKGILV